jgi:DNA repair exonuclease SbcCD ATPase subunit
MYKYIIFIIILGALLYLAKDNVTEHFESTSYIQILSKLNNKALQLYKGNIETSLTLNSKKGNDYYPQLWINENGKLKSAYSNKYLTISNDESKVVLDVLDSSKKQTWNIDSNGYITIGDLALQVEGDNTSEDALVVVTKKGDGQGFQWYTESVSVDIERVVLATDVPDAKIEKDSGDIIKSTSLNCTYSLWLNVNSFDYKRGTWKNVFNRGNKDTSDRAPSVWIAPSEQRLHIRCDTSSSKNEGIDYSKFVFALNQWYYLSFSYSEKDVSFFVDGQLSEKYTFKGVPIHKGNFFQSLMGGFDGQMKQLEYINKTMVGDEIIKRMKETNPEQICKEDRVTTVIKNNLVKSIDEWKTSNLDKIKNNEECPPQKLGGNTVSFTLKSEGKLETEFELIENQYYDLSIWVLSSNLKGINIRPNAGSWTGEWKNVKKTDGWKEIRWSFLNTDRSKSIGFELNNNEPSRNTLFLPVLSIKVLKVDSGNINIKEFRSNGTHPTCSIKDVGLNSMQGWCALKDKRDQYYIEADFDKLYQVQKIHTRGRGDYPQWTTEYRVEYFDVYHNKWRQYGGRLEGNQDMNSVKTNDVDILTDKIRVYPISFQSWPSMRISFSGSIGIKDKCNDYKVKSETLMNLIEREKYLKLYNRECKKISFYEYEMALEKEKDTLQSLQTKLEKAEIDAKTYESKYKDATEKIEEFERRQKNTENTKEIIESNNRTMTDKSLPSKVDDKCNPIQDKTSDKASDKKSTAPAAKASVETKNKIEKEGLTDHQILQKLLEGMDKINKDLSTKETKLIKIQAELDKLGPKTTDTADKTTKKTLEKKKKSTKEDIVDLKKQLQTCQANFSGVAVREHFESSPSVTVSSEPTQLTAVAYEISPYDIRRHKQYKDLISSIQTKIKKEYSCEKKDDCPKAECPKTDTSKCTPFNQMDITKHKDYPSLVEYVYELTKKQFSDITKHKDYKNLVKMVQNKTIKEYGRKTETGYVKCPNNCELINSINIENHPKFRQLLRAVVKRTIERYGEPIPGTSPVLYRRCSSDEKNNVLHNIADMSSNKCTQKFNMESFADVSMGSSDDFDIKNHKQYPELMEKVKASVKAKYSTCDTDKDEITKLKELAKKEKDAYEAEIKKLKEKALVLQEDITQNDKYQKLVAAYKKCKTIEMDITKHPKYSEVTKKLACPDNSDISVIDITRHPDINKYVLKSSLPIDLEISKSNDTDLKKLQAELDKLKNVHGKCVTRFQIERFSGTPSTGCSPSLSNKDVKEDKKELKKEVKEAVKEAKKEAKKEVKKEEVKEVKKISSRAQEVLDKLTDLTKEVYAKKEVTDDKKFFEIKKACNTALSFLKESTETDVPFIQTVYDLITTADKTGKLSVKKADEIMLSCLEKDQAVKTPAFYINEMLKKETTLAKNAKRLSNDMKDVEYCANNILQFSKKITKSPAVELAKVKPSTDNEENIKMIKEFRSSIKDEMKEFDKQLKAIGMKYDEIKKNVDKYENDNKRVKDDIKILYKKFMDRAITKWNQKKEESKKDEKKPNGPVAPPPLPLVNTPPVVNTPPAVRAPVMVNAPPRQNVIYRPVSVNGNDLVSEMRKLNSKVDGIQSKINLIKPVTGEELLGYNNKYSVLY